MMNTKTRFLVVEKTSLKAPSYHEAKNGNVFDTAAGAKRSCTAINRKIAAHNERNLKQRMEWAQDYAVRTFTSSKRINEYVDECRAEWTGDTREFVVMTDAEFAKADVLVETYNLLNPSGGVVMIRKSQLGGCCDPATETYHCT